MAPVDTQIVSLFLQDGLVNASRSQYAQTGAGDGFRGEFLVGCIQGDRARSAEPDACLMFVAVI